ncbi:MAG: glycoside hydrolase family 15 protein [Planctomycetota bacterium]
MPREIVLGNGLALAAFDSSMALRELYFPYVGQVNHSLGRASHLGIDWEGCVRWFGDDETWRIDSELSRDGREARAHLSHPKLPFSLDMQITWAAEKRVLRRRLRFHWKPGSNTKLRGRLLVHHDLALGEGDLSNEVRAYPREKVIVHRKREYLVQIEGLDPAGRGFSDWTLGRRDDFEGQGVRAAAAKTEGQLGRNPCAVGAGESLMAWELVPETNAPQTFDIYLTASADGTRPAGKAAASAFEPREDEAAAFVFATRDDCELPQALLQIESQSIGQLLAHTDRGGAMIAAADTWNLDLSFESYAYCWPRDGAFIARALDESGHREVASSFFGFAQRIVEREGCFRQRYHPDGHLGSSWHAEPKDDETHLPIQSDEAALVLWAFCRRERGRSESEQSEFAERLERLATPLAEFLCRYRCETTKLPLPSYDLWEERFGVHTFSVAATAAALRAASALPVDAAHKERWGSAAAEIEDNLPRYLFHRELGRYARRAEVTPEGYHLDMTADSSLAGLFLFNAVAAQDEKVTATMQYCERVLEIPGPVGGWARYEGDRYERQDSDDVDLAGNPWVLTSLWMCEWRIARARTLVELDRAQEILSWVVKRARPSGALAEQFDPRTAEPRSVMPLSWSHAALVSAVCHYRRRRGELG